MIRGGLSKGHGMMPKPFSLTKVEVNNIIYFNTPHQLLTQSGLDQSNY